MPRPGKQGNTARSLAGGADVGHAHGIVVVGQRQIHVSQWGRGAWGNNRPRSWMACGRRCAVAGPTVQRTGSRSFPIASASSVSRAVVVVRHAKRCSNTGIPTSRKDALTPEFSMIVACQPIVARTHSESSTPATSESACGRRPSPETSPSPSGRRRSPRSPSTTTSIPSPTLTMSSSACPPYPQDGSRSCCRTSGSNHALQGGAGKPGEPAAQGPKSWATHLALWRNLS